MNKEKKEEKMEQKKTPVRDGHWAEKKKQDFERLAEKRMGTLIKDLELLGNLSDTSNYKYDQEQVSEMFTALQNAVEESKKRFAPKKKGRPFSFKGDK